MVWMFGLQLFVSGAFHKVPTAIVGVVPNFLTAALIGWTVYKVMEETWINHAIGKDLSEQASIVLWDPNGDKRVMAIGEFNTLYEPVDHQTKDPLLTGFCAYRSTMQVRAHRLTVDDVRTRFPNGRFISSSGAPVSVHSGQYILTPFPQGGDVSVVGPEQFEEEYLASIEEAPNGRVVSQVDMLRVWDAMLRREGSIYEKITKIHAKCTREEGTIETIVGEKIEARRAYAKGDYIVCGSRGGRYPMPERQFTSRYSTTRSDPASDPVLAIAGFRLYKAKGKVRPRPSLSCICTARSLDSPHTAVAEKVWSHKLTPDEIAEHFRSGRFFGKCKWRAFLNHFRLPRRVG